MIFNSNRTQCWFVWLIWLIKKKTKPKRNPEFKSIQMNSNEFKSNQINSNQFKSIQINSNQLEFMRTDSRFCWFSILIVHSAGSFDWFDWLKRKRRRNGIQNSNQFKSIQMNSNQIKSIQINSNQLESIRIRVYDSVRLIELAGQLQRVNESDTIERFPNWQESEYPGITGFSMSTNR